MPRRLTIEQMQQIALDKGGKCLTNQYMNDRTKLLWMCSKGHKWTATPFSIKRGTWCPICGKIRMGNALRSNIEEMQEIAQKHDGKCISNEYIDDKTKLTWMCSKGHKWDSTPNNIKNGTWCPICSKDIGPRKKMDKTLQLVKKIAKEKGGECLSSSYETNHSKLRFRCQYGHEWDALPGRIKRGSWCPKCYAKNRREKLAKYTIDDMRRYAQSKGGECLSTEFDGMHEPLVWKCHKGHVWKGNPGSLIYQDAWCRKCGAIRRGEKRRTPIEIFQELAQKRGGRLLSNEYVNQNTKLEWECEEGHTFWSVPGPIRSQGVWCPQCSSGLNERITRGYFGYIFNKEFPKKHPNWLLSEKGKRMELDGYNEELRIAFEYQGEQHFSPVYIGENKELKKIQERDELKKQLCEKNNVSLITIPFDVKRKEIQKYILNECKKRGLQIIQDKLVDFRTLDVFSPKKLKELQEIARKRSGKCLSKGYMGDTTHLQWQCSEGHTWEAPPGSIKAGHWCPECVRRKKGTIEQMHNWAITRGGKCLSKEYKNNKTKLQWECNVGHVFLMAPNSVQQGYWCPTCSHKNTGDKLRKYSIEDIQHIAKEKNGKCLSSKYINCETKIKWECEKGHRWLARLHDVKRGHWCPECYNLKRKRRLIKYNRNYKQFPHKHKF